MLQWCFELKIMCMCKRKSYWRLHSRVSTCLSGFFDVIFTRFFVSFCSLSRLFDSLRAYNFKIIFESAFYVIKNPLSNSNKRRSSKTLPAHRLAIIFATNSLFVLSKREWNFRKKQQKEDRERKNSTFQCQSFKFQMVQNFEDWQWVVCHLFLLVLM